MAMQEQGSRETLIVEPGKSKHFSPGDPQAKYIIMEGIAAAQEWRRDGEGGVRQGSLIPILTGEIFPAGGGTEIVIFNMADQPLKFRALREFSALQKME